MLGDDLYYSVWALSGGIGLLPCPKVPSKWGWPTRTRALPIRDLRQIAYLLPMWGGIWSGVVFLWRRLICPQNSSLRMFWYRDLNSSHFFPRFGVLEHEANRTLDISATFIGSRKSFVNASGSSVCPAKRRIRVFCLSPIGLNRLNRCSRGRTTPIQILCQNMVCTWYVQIHFLQGFFTQKAMILSGVFS